MPTLLDTLRARRVTALTDAETLTKTADAAGRDFTPEEQTAFDTHMKSAAALKEQIATAEVRASQRASLKQDLADLDRPNPRKTVDDDGDLDPSASTPLRAREKFLDDPMRGFKSHRNIFEAVRTVGLGAKPDDRLKSMSARYGVQSDGTPISPMAAAGSDEQGTYADPYGGFLVPRTTLPGVITTGFDPDPFASLTQKIPMATPEVALNARVDKTHTTSVSGGLVVYRRNETAGVTASRMSFEQIVLHADSLMGVAYASEEVLRDSPLSFTTVLERGFRDQFGAKAMIERLDGLGVGCPLGINNAPGKIDVGMEGGQSATTIRYANLVKMRARIYGYGASVWFANHDCLPELLSVTQPGSTIPLFQQNGGIETLFGRPIFFTEFAKALGTTGDLELVNWGEYLEGEYEPIQGLTSIHVRFVEHEQAFKFWKRNAGQPWWRTVMTPVNGSTIAPIVRLARS